MAVGDVGQENGVWWRMLKYDVPASLVVFLVALPLCMGVALASGLPAEAGLITGIIGGLVVGFISGSPMQVSGPAAGLIVLVYSIVHKDGPSSLGVILLLAGAMQLCAGCFKLAQWFRMVSPAVIQGMLAGIGAVILLSQLHVMMGSGAKANGLDNLLALPGSLFEAFLPEKNFSHAHAAFIGLLTITAIVVLQENFKKTPIPASLAAVTLASVVSGLLGFQIAYVEVPTNATEIVRIIDPGTLTMLLSSQIWIYALAVALIASAESLLCATAVDQLHRGPRTHYDRELAAQGIGNLLCGLCGGLPMTGVIVRSSANIDAGARTRVSAILHGAWILAFAVFLPWLLNFIPIASLAGILVYTGYKLINLKVIKELSKFGKGEVAIYAATFFTIVLEDLLTGVILGMVLTGLKLLHTFSHLRVRVEQQGEGQRTILHLEGSATFLRLPRLAAVLDQVPPQTEMHVRFDHLDYIDHACLDLLLNWGKQHQATGGKLVLDWDSLHACFRQQPTTAPALTMDAPAFRRAS